MSDNDLSPEDQKRMNEIVDDFVRTYVTFRPVKCETVGGALRWTFAPVIHDKPVVRDESMYLTGDGVQSPLGTFSTDDR